MLKSELFPTLNFFSSDFDNNIFQNEINDTRSKQIKYVHIKTKLLTNRLASVLCR